MDEHSKSMRSAYAEDDGAMLPDGWGEGDDFFNQDAWTGAPAADGQAEREDDPALPDAKAEPDAADPVTVGDEAEGETGGPTTPEGKPKLKFSATVDHRTREVELDEKDLPALYQKAQVTERTQAKLARMQPVYEQAQREARRLGYASAEEMLGAVGGEAHRETSSAPEASAIGAKQRSDQGITPYAAPKRDLQAEVEALLALRPELRQPGARLPDEVTAAFAAGSRPLSVVYLDYEARQRQAAYDAILKENKALKQNAEAASRAPVRGVSKGGRTEAKSDDDPFLRGFYAEE
ncbi:MAG: hypothetical protein K6G17_01620 [Oscillospiraceae bacterium]|nr:hypothetical protein [Oscillospiraceae bacterium]